VLLYAVNRGVGVADGKVFIATQDCRVIALDAATGRSLWNVLGCRDTSNSFYSMATYVYKDQILLGTGGGDNGTIGLVSAFSIKDGKRLWDWQTIPGPGQPGHATWPGDSWKHGGVQLAVDNEAGELVPGAYASVHFNLPLASANLSVPASALIFDHSGLQVATLGPHNRVIFKPVTVARDLGDSVELSSGLTANDRIIDSPPDGIANGDAVRIGPGSTSGGMLADARTRSSLHPGIAINSVYAKVDTATTLHYAEAVRDGRLTIPIGRIVTLAGAPEAQAAAEKGGVAKIVLTA
jgi:hypothetical protein